MSNLQQCKAAASFACFELAKTSGLPLHELGATTRDERMQAFVNIRSNYVRSFDLVEEHMKAWIADVADRQKLRVAALDAGECPTCAADPHGPPHNASSRCQSGGYDHCSCDTCY